MFVRGRLNLQLSAGQFQAAGITANEKLRPWIELAATYRIVGSKGKSPKAARQT
jgi:hypothetical protein